MTEIKALDVLNQEFGEGDRVATSTNRGIRVGRVLAMKGYDTTDAYGKPLGFKVNSVSIDMEEMSGKDITFMARAYEKRRTFEYSQAKFLKL